MFLIIERRYYNRLYQIIYDLYKTAKEVLYINFEDETLQKYSLTELIAAYLEHANVNYLFVDEIQNCEGWVQAVRKIYDRRELRQIWISGSHTSFFSFLVSFLSEPTQLFLFGNGCC